MDNDFIYQHDNAKYNISRQIQKKLKELRIEVLDWPDKSPDMNPIKNLWGIIDDKLKSQPMSNVKELTEALATAWLSIVLELCEKLVFLIPQRIAKCIVLDGKCIDY